MNADGSLAFFLVKNLKSVEIIIIFFYKHKHSSGNLTYEALASVHLVHQMKKQLC